MVHEFFPIVATIGSETKPEINSPSCVRANILKVYVPAGILSIYQVYHPGIVGEEIRSSGRVLTSWLKLSAFCP